MYWNLLNRKPIPKIKQIRIPINEMKAIDYEMNLFSFNVSSGVYIHRNIA